MISSQWLDVRRFLFHAFALNKVGTALDNMNNLGAGETWKFKAMSVDTANAGGTYKLDEITGF